MRRRPILLTLTALSLGGAPCALAPRLAAAQTEEELAAARRLFTDALAEEQAGRFTSALEKFQRVQRLRDTVRVRYRIASCLEGMGALTEASAAYRATVELGAGEPNELDVVRAAKERLADVEARTPRLRIVRSDGSAEGGAAVRVDGRSLPEGALSASLPLDPGTHTIEASLPGAPPFETRITLSEGAQMSLVVPVGARDPGGERPAGEDDRAGSKAGSANRTVAVIVGGAGVAFLAAAGITLAMRESDIAKLEGACPGGACPPDRRDELSSVHARAKLEGPLAAVFGGVGLAATAVGVVWLVAQASEPSEERPRAATKPASRSRLGGGALPGGGYLTLERTF